MSSDPRVNSAIWTKTDVYYVPLKTFTEAEPPVPQIIKTGKLVGYSGSPVFSHNGKKLAFKRMRHKQYESDKWRLLLVPDVKDLSNVQEFYQTDDGEGRVSSFPYLFGMVSPPFALVTQRCSLPCQQNISYRYLLLTPAITVGPAARDHRLEPG